MPGGGGGGGWAGGMGAGVAERNSELPGSCQWGLNIAQPRASFPGLYSGRQGSGVGGYLHPPSGQVGGVERLPVSCLLEGFKFL